ncbi:hypothetical protein VTJ04DRAFT_5193 [Mycothermus thermophilus]|uniref:uncharacterized protein n=1 Tax=Humicola insolens TaxID=85995 RepID=UPI00374498DD
MTMKRSPTKSIIPINHQRRFPVPSHHLHERNPIRLSQFPIMHEQKCAACRWYMGHAIPSMPVHEIISPSPKQMHPYLPIRTALRHAVVIPKKNNPDRRSMMDHVGCSLFTVPWSRGCGDEKTRRARKCRVATPAQVMCCCGPLSSTHHVIGRTRT